MRTTNWSLYPKRLMIFVYLKKSNFPSVSIFSRAIYIIFILTDYFFVEGHLRKHCRLALFFRGLWSNSSLATSSGQIRQTGLVEKIIKSSSSNPRRFRSSFSTWKCRRDRRTKSTSRRLRCIRFRRFDPRISYQLAHNWFREPVYKKQATRQRF